MSQSEKQNARMKAETSLRMLEKAAERMREYLASGDPAKAADSEFYARAAHKNSVDLFNSTHADNPLATRKVA